MPNQINELAKQAGGTDEGNGAMWVLTETELQRFAELLCNAKLEEAAVKCENELRGVIRNSGSTNWVAAAEIADSIAKELRSMKK